MGTEVFPPRGKLRPRRYQVREPSKPREPVRKNYFPYALLAALLALLAVPLLLGVIGKPEAPSSTIAVEKPTGTEIGTLAPVTIPLEPSAPTGASQPTGAEGQQQQQQVVVVVPGDGEPIQIQTDP
jgi:hypothetical protein